MVSSDTALEFYKVGHSKGDPLATYALGRQYLRYNHDPNFQLLGYKMLMQSKDAGNIGALNELGRFYLTTQGELFDAERGLRYFIESAALGNTNGQNSLGLVYKEGMGGIPKDSARAVELLQTAAESGHPVAPTSLGRIYASDALSEPDYEKALTWYDIGLQRGDPWAGANGAWIVFNKRPPGYENFDGVARAAKAAVMTNPQAAESALELLRAQPKTAINAGAQKLLNELGATLEIDGNFGRLSVAALDETVSYRPHGSALSNPMERLLNIAKEYWKQNNVRYDLY